MIREGPLLLGVDLAEWEMAMDYSDQVADFKGRDRASNRGPEGHLGGSVG